MEKHLVPWPVPRAAVESFCFSCSGGGDKDNESGRRGKEDEDIMIQAKLPSEIVLRLFWLGETFSPLGLMASYFLLFSSLAASPLSVLSFCTVKKAANIGDSGMTSREPSIRDSLLNSPFGTLRSLRLEIIHFSGFSSSSAFPFNRYAPLRPRHLFPFYGFSAWTERDVTHRTIPQPVLNGRIPFLSSSSVITDSEDDAKQFHSFIR